MRWISNLSSSRIGLRPPFAGALGLPAPIGLPSLPMPAQHRFGPRDEQCPAPTREPATSQDPEPPIGVPQPGSRASTLIDEELLAEAKILRNQGGSRLKDTCDCHSQPGQHLSILSPKLSQGESVTRFYQSQAPDLIFAPYSCYAVRG